MWPETGWHLTTFLGMDQLVKAHDGEILKGHITPEFTH